MFAFPCAPLRFIPLLLALGSGDSVAHWAPEIDTSVQWTWTVEQKLELGEMSMEAQSSFGSRVQGPLVGLSLSVRDELELRVHDRVLARSDERLESLQRHYDHARRTTRTRIGSGTSTGVDARKEELLTVSRLEEATVRFDRDGEGDEPRVLPAEGESVEEEWLWGLDEELDLRGLLDGQARELGERWHLDEASVRRLLRPGGDLRLRVEEQESSEATNIAELGWLTSATFMDRDSYAFGRAHYAKVVTDEGRRFAQIDVEVRVEGDGDVYDSLKRLTEGRSRARSWVDYVRGAELEQATVLRGELYWDLEARRADSLDLRGELEAFLEVEYDMSPIGRDDLRWLLTAELRGELRIEVRSSPLSDED